MSFKLETDQCLLMKKAIDSLVVNGVNAVLANDLNRRYDEVHLVTNGGSTVIKLERSKSDDEIEGTLIGPTMIQIHKQYIDSR
jgi:hypothetical protein